MVEVEENNENIVHENPPLAGSMPCHSSLGRLAHMARTPTNARKAEMETRLPHIIYVNPFVGLYHEDPYTHITKF